MKPASVAASPAQEDIRLISSPATSRIEFFPHMLALICVLTLAPAAVAGTVTITSPTNGATVASPVHVHATYSGSASYMKLWLDHKASTMQSNTNVFDQQVSLSAGAHVITVQALDSSNGLIYADTVNITVGSGSHTVTITSPTDGATVSSPVHVHATYSSSVIASYMKAWIDGKAGTVQLNTNVFDTNVALSAGAHVIKVQAKDASSGVVYTSSGSNITVSSSGTALNYTTWKNDNGRTGQQRKETILTPANVNSNTFGLLFSDSVDGYVFAQPLYLANQTMTNGVHNVVFVATEHDSVYAFDADHAGSTLWKTSLLPSGATTVPQALVHSTIFPENGVTGTPVIDPSTGTLYVVAETLENNNVVYRLHALSVITGKEQGGSPVVINASGWQPMEQNQRPGLLLANGNVYIAFGSHGDVQPYHGWIFAYSAASLAQVGVWNVTPTASEGAIWMAGSGLAADSSGDIYAMTSNGNWNGTSNFSDSFVKLSPNLTVLDYFTPYNQSTLAAHDLDLGSGGVLLVPNQSGTFQHEIIGCGKSPAIYVLNRDNMGKFQSSSNSQIIQEVDGQVGGTTGQQAPDRCFMTPAFWQQNVYFMGNNDVIKAFKLNASTGLLSTTPSSQGSSVVGFPGAQPAVSSNGSSNGIVWAVEYSKTTSALHAFDATNVSKELYRSASVGAGAKWAVPTVSNGKVYVGTAGKLFVFGP